MSLYIFSAFAVVLLGGLIFFIIRGFEFVPEEQKAVPIHEIEGFKDFKKEEETGKTSQSAKLTLTKHILDENLKKEALLARTEKNVKSSPPAENTKTEDEIKSKEQTPAFPPVQEHRPPTERAAAVSQSQPDVSREDASRKPQETVAAANSGTAGQSQDSKHDEAMHRVSVLEQENKQFKDCIVDLKKELELLQQKADSSKAEYEKILEREKLKILAMEDEMSKIISDRQRLSDEKEAVERVGREYENLKADYQKETNKIKRLEDELVNVSEAKDEQLNELQATVAKLEQEQANMRQSNVEPLTQKITNMQFRLEQIEQEKDEVNKIKEELERNLKRIKEYNGLLLEKEKLLQYELTKSRAYAVGLEKICEDFKLRLDHMAKAA